MKVFDNGVTKVWRRGRWSFRIWRNWTGRYGLELHTFRSSVMRYRSVLVTLMTGRAQYTLGYEEGPAL